MLRPHEQEQNVTQRRGPQAALAFAVFALWAAGVFALFPAGQNSVARRLHGQHEARTGLRALAEAQKSHFLSKGSYAYDFSSISFRPGPPMRYVIAFPETCTSRYAPPMAVTSSLESISRGAASADSRPHTMTLSDREKISRKLESLTAIECPDPANGFIALAVGNLDDDDDVDVWSIDRDFNLQHLQSDL